jgi:hypothetical protein
VSFHWWQLALPLPVGWNSSSSSTATLLLLFLFPPLMTRSLQPTQARMFEIRVERGRTGFG